MAADQDSAPGLDGLGGGAGELLDCADLLCRERAVGHLRDQVLDAWIGSVTGTAVQADDQPELGPDDC
ncbi:hypothetical protein Slala03_76530 [Streptomyces lavendulae subsp. lavendulae]|nr:hypothetical protein Slala03_76530 [Streptomyces lavendulae subsp. lavendulae]